MQVLSPVRPDDFVNSCGALRQWMERLAALDRLSLDRIVPCNFGFGFRFQGSTRFRKWWLERAEIGSHAGWLQSSELDDYGNYLILNRQISAQIPGGMFGAVCSWPSLSEAAEWLRTACVGPLLLKTYGANILQVYSTDILHSLDIPEGSFNSGQLPCWCSTKWGRLLRVNLHNTERVLSYLLVDTSSQARLVDLGAETVVGIASDCSELRISLCRRWHDDLVLKDLERWRKANVSRSRKKEAAPQSE